MRRKSSRGALAVVATSVVAAVVACALVWSPGVVGSVGADTVGAGTNTSIVSKVNDASISIGAGTNTTATDAAVDTADPANEITVSDEAASMPSAPYEPGVALVSIRKDATAAEVAEAIAGTSGIVAQRVTDGDLTRGFVEVELEPGMEVEDAVAALSAAGDVVRGAQPNYTYAIVEDAAVESDPSEVLPATTHVSDERASEQWALKSVNADKAWDIAKGSTPKSGPAVTVAIIDQGFDIGHPDLAANIVAPYNAATEGTTAEALAFGTHGTHVAGIVSAVADNEIGVAGVSYNARVMPIRVSEEDGTMYTSSLLKAYTYLMREASANNVRVVNMSLGHAGAGSSDDLLEEKIDEAFGAGIVTVAAAGNRSAIVTPGSTPYFDNYPADFDNVVSVMNLEQTGGRGVTLSATSNYNGPGETDKNIAAPGSDILSTYGQNQYSLLGGTSMASPCVAGITALEFAADPTLTAAEARELLYSTAKDLGDPGFDEYYGYGEADAFAAARAALMLHETSEERSQRLIREVGEARSLIANIPDASRLTLSDLAQVEDARWAYDLLDAEHQAQLDATGLVAAERRIEELAEAAYSQVVRLIADLPSRSDLKLSDAERVNAARAAYDALPATWQERIDSAKLSDAESRMRELQNCQLDINFLLDGKRKLNQTEAVYGTFDLEVTKDGAAIVSKQGITDYVGTIPLGATWRITNVRAIEGRVFSGAVGDVLEGTIGDDYSDGRYEVILRFDSLDGPGQTCTVTLDANGGTVSPKTLVLKVSQAELLPEATRDGYRFMGWATTKHGSVAYAPGQKVAFETNTTLYAQWEAHIIIHRVSFGDAAPSVDVPTGTALTLPNPSVAASHLRFVGWKAADGSVRQPGDVVVVDDDLFFEAMWEAKKTTHTLCIKADEGIRAITINGAQANTVELEEGEQVKLVATVRPGYTFTGWGLIEGRGTDCGIKMSANELLFTMGAGNVTLLAVARRNTTTSVAKATVTLPETSYPYTGKAVKPEPTVTLNGAKLLLGTDYTLSYSNNVNKGIATVTVRGTGNYTGTARATFKIVATSIANATVTLPEASYPYTGFAQRPVPTVVLDGRQLVAGTDYTFTHLNNTKAGVATVRVTGRGYYTGVAMTTFEIVPIDLSGAVVNVAGAYAYTGKAIVPTISKVTVQLNGKKIASSGYTLSFSDNVNVGTASVTVRGRGTYTGTATGSFAIKAASISSTTAKLAATSYSYTGDAFTPAVALTYKGVSLSQDRDYTLAYTNNISKGRATVSVTGRGNFTGTRRLTFTIKNASIAQATITIGSASYQYTGRAVTPGVTVRLPDGRVLKAGADYRVSYESNVRRGMAKVKVTGIGNYSGSATTTFVIR